VGKEWEYQNNGAMVGKELGSHGVHIRMGMTI
jgi:hypothetical protein